MSLLTLFAYINPFFGLKSQSNLGFSRAHEVPVIGMKNVYSTAKLILMLKKDNLNWRISHQRGTSSIRRYWLPNQIILAH